jgi:hypothetical protein
VLDVKLPFARTGRIWPYSGDAAHPVILYDYTATRERAGPEEFLKGYRGYLQADAYGGYDAFFKDPARGVRYAAANTAAPLPPPRRSAAGSFATDGSAGNQMQCSFFVLQKTGSRL